MGGRNKRLSEIAVQKSNHNITLGDFSFTQIHCHCLHHSVHDLGRGRSRVQMALPDHTPQSTLRWPARIFTSGEATWSGLLDTGPL